VIKAKWRPPPVGFLKINIDGAVAKQQIAGAVSAVCRDDQGRFLGYSSIKVEGITNPIVCARGHGVCGSPIVGY
jgi:hypothetical protein